MQNLGLEGVNGHQKAGFRLYRFEVWNWGTFHNQIWTIEPSGNTSLLTGANGSGKSTLVDGLLTLLVPNQKRNYNQAAGTTQRRERSELTYLRGAYGKVQSEDGYASKTQYLRGKDSYSVLLAHFFNEGLGEKVTLAQVLWMQNGIQKFFVVARDELHVGQQFSNFESIRALRRRLKKLPNVELFTSFTQYSKRFRKLFGLRSEKALDLFNQTVTIKEIGRLNDFVRTHMLEVTHAQTKIERLQDNFENLTLAHDAMLKAQRQLQQLEPLLAKVKKHEEIGREIALLKEAELVIPAYFAAQKKSLVGDALGEARQQFAQEENQRQAIEQQLEQLRQQKINLSIAIEKDEVGLQIRQLGQQIEALQRELKGKQKLAKDYNRLARLFSLPDYSDEESFYASARKASSYNPKIEEALQELENKRVEHEITLRQLTVRYDELRGDLSSLRDRKSQIPRQNLKIRGEILSALQITEDDLPFIGELLKVKERERAWEGAIERLLHGFGLCLLVPEAHYHHVNQYVNQTNLRGRLVYYRVTDQVARAARNLDDEAVAYKLEIKPGTTFHRWLERELSIRFTHVCCESLEAFQHERIAITKNGLIKGGNRRHEKDDRRSIHDRKTYILGWNNVDKVKAIEAEATQLGQQLQVERQAIKAIEKEKKQRQKEKEFLRDFLRFDDFTAIDWQSDAAQMRELDRQKRRLEESSDHLRQLDEELEAVVKDIHRTDASRTKMVQRLANVQRDIEHYEHQQRECEEDLSAVSEKQLERHTPRIQSYSEARLSLKTIDRELQEVLKAHRESMNKEIGRQHRLEKRIEKAMQSYKRDYEAETTDMDASIEAAPEYDRMLQRIKQEDLPRHQEEFKKLLNRRIIENIAYLKSDLDRYVEDIEEKIRNLNTSLRSIPYTPSTFIQLKSEPTRDAEIRDFQSQLKACLPDVGLPDSDQSNEASFQKIRALLKRLREDSRWTKKVTDVRQWLDFSASERYKEDESEKHYYSDSSGKSGGQKAKLAYTILASAIAYQFGLEYDRTKSKTFRFVVVDEAFSRSDEINARYALSLFEELQLQLLIITPAKDIHVVEPFISACHYVINNEAGNYSRVHNMNMTQYEAQKAAFLG